jgi:hypothetical protein
MKLLEFVGISPLFAFWGMVGLLIHFLKTWQAAETRGEVFFKRATVLFYAINLVTTLALIGVGHQMPAEMYVPSTVSSLMIGLSSSSMLSGFMKVKAPGELAPSDKVLLNITSAAKETTQNTP